MAQQAGQVSPDGKWSWNGTEWVPIPAVPAEPHVAWARPYESPRPRFMLARIFLLANIVTLLVSVAIDIVLLAMLAQAEGLNETQLATIQTLDSFFLVFYYATIIPAIVFVSMWLHRIVRNMPVLGSPDARWSPSGAVLRCFIPVFNWFHPLGGTLDAWRASDPTRRLLDVSERRAIPPPGLFAGWWALWLSASALAYISSRMTTSEDLGTFTMGTWISGLSDILFGGAAFLLIMVMRAVTGRQDHKNELIAAGQLA